MASPELADRRLEGRRVVVFGGSGALGLAVVGRLAAEGAAVVSVDVALPPDDRRSESISYGEANALDEASVAAVFGGLEGDLWGVVNVVGGDSAGEPLAELDLGTLRGQIDLNLVTAATITTHAAVTLTGQGAGGRILHSSSRAAVSDGKLSFPYSVSKFGVVRLVEAAAAEMRDHGICVNCLLPSVIDTPANRAAMPSSDHAKWPKPSELAGVFAFLLSEEAGLISGAAIP